MSKAIERLQIQDFLGIKHADIVVKQFNVIIGPQASGKSVIAKLVAYFNQLGQIFLRSLNNNDRKARFDSNLLKQFELSFPRYTWEHNPFTIRFAIDGISFTVANQLDENNHGVLSIEYSESLFLDYEKTLNQIEQNLANGNTPVLSNNEMAPILKNYPTLFAEHLFIPASRSFFATLQNNIFGFLSADINIDPLLKQFGRSYELIKRQTHQPTTDIAQLVKTIIKGEYKFQDQQDWIINQQQKVNLAHASSGQQEALPMLLMLSKWQNKEDNEKKTIFIEEPEAHLFPVAQNQVISLLSLVKKLTNTRIFITSHSPYMLSAINNLIMAHHTISKGGITSQQFEQINGPCAPIALDDISAYSITDGTAQDIKDEEYHMIGADMLDSVSDHFENVINTLLEADME